MHLDSLWFGLEAERTNGMRVGEEGSLASWIGGLVGGAIRGRGRREDDLVAALPRSEICGQLQNLLLF